MCRSCKNTYVYNTWELELRVVDILNKHNTLDSSHASYACKRTMTAYYSGIQLFTLCKQNNIAMTSNYMLCNFT